MTPSLLTLLAPVVASGLLAILAGWFAGRRAGNERARAFAEEWTRSRQDKAAAETVALIQDIATKLARAAHTMWWLSWRAAHHPEVLDDEAVGKFQWDFHELIPQIVGAQAALRAMSPGATEAIDPMVVRLNELCTVFSEAAIQAKARNFATLAGHLDVAVAYKQELNEALKGASGRVLAAYGGSARVGA